MSNIALTRIWNIRNKMNNIIRLINRIIPRQQNNQLNRWLVYSTFRLFAVKEKCVQLAVKECDGSVKDYYLKYLETIKTSINAKCKLIGKLSEAIVQQDIEDC